MDDNKKPSGGLPGGGLWWVALVAAGAYFVHEAPLQGSRPVATDPKPYPYLARQDIDARLWQDPLSAITRGREDVKKRYGDKRPDLQVNVVTHLPGSAASAEVVGADDKSRKPATTAHPYEPGNKAAPDPDPAPSERSEHAMPGLAADIKRKTPSGTAKILAVMVQGGSYAESVEARRRARYAVLAGLKQQGFIPEDAAHLGYALSNVTTNQDEALPEFIPYEWFVDKEGRTRLLTLWLDEYIFATNTLARIAELRKELGVSPTTSDDGSGFVVVGPAYSSTLQDMVTRLYAPAKAVDPPQPGTDSLPTKNDPTFYAYSPTTDDAHLLGALESPQKNSSLHQAFLSKGVHVFRTIETDDMLVHALRIELKRRGVAPSEGSCPLKVTQHVVLIAEWDTLYGRTLPELMSNELGGSSKCGTSTIDYTHRFSYLRGLDGQLSTLEAGEQDGARRGTNTRAIGTANADRGELQKQIERPEGQGQLDYLRRMASDLLEQDRVWQRRGRGSIAAIGVLGSDVFDKLLILQALRPEFPNVLFFTTDLDARLLHPQEQPWARNLIVASSFGLQLRPRLQNDIPPFRDVYQTSIYLSTLIALNNTLKPEGATQVTQETIDGWLSHPRIFEIGRTMPFDFSPPRNSPPCAFDPSVSCDRSTEKPGLGNDAAIKPGRSSRVAGVSLASCAGGVAQLSNCGEVHPLGTPRSPVSVASHFYKEILLVVFGILFLILFTGAPPWMLGFLRKDDEDESPATNTVAWSPMSLRQWSAVVASKGQMKDLVVVQKAYRRMTHRALVDAKGNLQSNDYFVRWLASRTVLVVSSFIIGFVLVVLFMASSLWIWEWFRDLITEHGNGEPISFTEGVSIWPTQLLRLLVVILSAAFVYAAWRRLTDNLQDISRRFKFEPTYKDIQKRVREDYAELPMWKRVLRMFSFRLNELDGGPKRSMTELSWSAQLFWMKYLYQGRLRSRAVRVLLAVAIFAIISVTVVGHFGWPNTPYRGEVSKLINGIMLGASGATMLCVIFFVVDATVFGYQLIRSLQADVLGDPSALHLTVGTRWARSTRDDYASRFEVDLRHLDAIILMDFISLRTTVIAKLVYFPFIIIAIMVLARNHLFDNWNMPLGLILVFSVSVAIVVVCAVLLRRGAESVRDRILQLLGDELIRLKGQSEAAAAQVDALIARVRSVRAGAFAPYSQQPIVRAFLLPATTLGGPALLDYLSMANF